MTLDVAQMRAEFRALHRRTWLQTLALIAVSMLTGVALTMLVLHLTGQV